MNLLIARSNFHSYSETFIDEQIKQLAPMGYFTKVGYRIEPTAENPFIPFP
jgi:hypothetical protein